MSAVTWGIIAVAAGLALGVIFRLFKGGGS